MLLGELQIDANNSHYKHFENALYMESLSNEYAQAGDTRIPLPRKSLWTPQKIVDCKVGLCTSLWTVAEFL